MTENAQTLEEKQVKLDLKDKKILFELDFNSRIPYSQLAKKVKLSKQGVEYKVKNLIKKKIVKGFYPVINVPKLGYLYCRLMITLQNTTKEKYKEIVQYLINHKKVFWLFKLEGMYNLILVIWAKSITEFKEFIEELEDRFEGIIKGKIETVATDVIHFQNRFLLGITETKEIHLKETLERIKIDKTDEEIISVLCENARTKTIEIAKKVNESAKVVAYRIKRLEKIKLIEGYRPIIDHNRIGYTYYKLLFNLNKISKQELKKLKQYIKSNSSVIYIVEGVGLPADLDIEIMVKTNKQLFEFIEDIKFKFPTLIGEYQIVIFMDTLKVKYLPF